MFASAPPRDGEIAGPAAVGWRAIGPVLAAGFALRVVAADVVQWAAWRAGKPCLFGDTFIYLELARTIREGTPFEVDQSGLPHFALRTPGYPLFLAACQALFGEYVLPIRLVQAALGTVGVYCLFRLVARAIPRRDVAIVAAWLGAVEPYGVGLGALILSEGLFVPLMLAGLWGLAALWTVEGEEGPGRPGLVAIGTGLAHGAAIQARPSWALLVPILLGAWVAFAGKGRREATRGAAIVAMTVAAVMMPWWARNYRVFGRFVPTVYWVGASLYDGLSPGATGASDMRFLDEPGIVGLGEESQDAELRRRAVAFARGHPGRALGLAAIKAWRFWSPWPNEANLRSAAVAVGSAAVTVPLFTLAGLGLWDRRRDPRALALLAGPLAYFLILHMIFVSSIRYRIPVFLPALGLAALGWRRVRGSPGADRQTGSS